LKKLIAAGAMLVGVMAGMPAHAATPDKFSVHSAADLVDICRTEPTDATSSAAIGFCHGYVVGVYRTLVEIQEARPKSRFFCVNERPASRTEAINAYVAWTSARPDEMTKVPMESIADYLKANYPCPTGGTAKPSISRPVVK